MVARGKDEGKEQLGSLVMVARGKDEGKEQLGSLE